MIENNILLGKILMAFPNFWSKFRSDSHVFEILKALVTMFGVSNTASVRE